MSWTRRWSIIGSIALAQLGIIVAYQALLSAGQAPASAEETVTPPIAVTLPQSEGNPPAGSPAIDGALPVMVPVGVQGAESLPLAWQQAVPIVDRHVQPAAANNPPMTPNLTEPPSSPHRGLPPTGYGPMPPMCGGPMPPTGPHAKCDISPNSPPLAGIGPIPSTGSPEKPLPQTQPPTVAQTPVEPCPWNLSMEIVNGRTHLTARNGTDVQFKIICDKLDLQTPRGRIDASGKVTIASESMEGACDRLTISWHEDVVMLEKVQMKCKLEGHEADMQADQLRLRLSRVIPVNESPSVPD